MISAGVVAPSARARGPTSFTMAVVSSALNNWGTAPPFSSVLTSSRASSEVMLSSLRSRATRLLATPACKQPHGTKLIQQDVSGANPLHPPQDSGLVHQMSGYGGRGARRRSVRLPPPPPKAR